MIDIINNPSCREQLKIIKRIDTLKRRLDSLRNSPPKKTWKGVMKYLRYETSTVLEKNYLHKKLFHNSIFDDGQRSGDKQKWLNIMKGIKGRG